MLMEFRYPLTFDNARRYVDDLFDSALKDMSFLDNEEANMLFHGALGCCIRNQIEQRQVAFQDKRERLIVDGKILK